MNVIRNVICTLIILPIGLQAETSHSSMAKDTITVVATGNQNTVFETPSMVSVVTNDTPWSQNAVTSAGMLKGVAGLSQTGAGRTNGRPLIYAAMTKAGVLGSWLTASVNSVTGKKQWHLSGSGTRQTYRSCPRAKLQSVRQWRAGRCSGLQNCRCSRFSSPRRDKRFKSVGKYCQW